MHFAGRETDEGVQRILDERRSNFHGWCNIEKCRLFGSRCPSGYKVNEYKNTYIRLLHSLIP